MDDNRPLPGCGYLHLLGERLFLLLPRRVVIIIIETDLADREHLRVSQQMVQFLECGRAGELGLVGMNAGRGQDARYSGFAGVAAAQFQRLLHGVRPVADANRQNRTHALLPGPLQQLIPVGIVPRAVKMCV